MRDIRLLLAASSMVVPLCSLGQTIDPFYAANYSFTDLGSVPGLPPLYGGLTFKAGDPNKVLIGGAANGASGMLYEIDVVRDGNGHVTGFSGTASVFAEAPYNDGGVTYGPNGVLFASRWPVNELAQYKPGSTTPDKITDMAALGVAQSHASLVFGPADRAYANKLKLASWSGGEYYDATYAPDGSGTFDILSVTQVLTLPGGPEGMVYVPLGSTLFGDSMLVSEFTAGNVASYDVDANGDPILSSRRDFITGLTGAEGAAIDPLTGDFVFSTFGGGDRVIVVKGFAVPEPTTLVGAAVGLVAVLRRRRNQKSR